MLDRVRVTLSGQLEADLSASTADILRAVADEHRQALVEATERTAAETRLEAEQQLSRCARVSSSARREELDAALRTVSDARLDERNIARRSSEMLGDVPRMSSTRARLRARIDALQSARESVCNSELEISDQTRLGEEQQARAPGSDRARDSRERTDTLPRSHECALFGNWSVLRSRLAQTTRLASAFRTLDEATSLGDILEHLAQSACQETGRTAVFLVNGEKLRGWRAMGFEAR